HWVSGRSITNACFSAGPTNSGANKSRRRARLTACPSPRDRFVSGAITSNCGCVDLDGSIFSSTDSCVVLRKCRGPGRSASERNRAEMIRQRSECCGRQEQQRTDDYDRAKQKTSEGKGVVAQSTQSEW